MKNLVISVCFIIGACQVAPKEPETTIKIKPIKTITLPIQYMDAPVTTCLSVCHQSCLQGKDRSIKYKQCEPENISVTGQTSLLCECQNEIYDMNFAPILPEEDLRG